MVILQLAVVSLIAGFSVNFTAVPRPEWIASGFFAWVVGSYLQKQADSPAGDTIMLRWNALPVNK
jgi:hypothetical protein